MTDDHVLRTAHSLVSRMGARGSFQSVSQVTRYKPLGSLWQGDSLGSIISSCVFILGTCTPWKFPSGSEDSFEVCVEPSSEYQ